MRDDNPTQVTVLKAVVRYRWAVLAITVLFGALGFLARMSQATQFVASSSLVLEDPATSSVLADQSVRPTGRFITNQLEILRSALVAQRAAELSNEQGIEIGITDVLRNATFVPLPNADVIVVTFTAEEPTVAGAVNSNIVSAYIEVQREQRRQSAEDVLERLTSAEEVLERSLDDLNAEIDAIGDARGIEQQTDLVLDELAAAQAQLIGVTDVELREVLLQRVLQLDQQLRTLRLAAEIEATRPEATALLRSLDQVQTRISDIARRKTEVEIDAETQSTGLIFASPPSVVSGASGFGGALRIFAGLLVGLVLSSILVYVYALSRRAFTQRLEPETVLGLSFLGEIPDFGKADSGVPVRDDPRSPAAEAFRFVASGLQMRAERSGHRTVMTVSGTVGDGKSTVVANTAIAAARSGLRVMVVDADFGNQATSSMLLGDVSLHAGLTELVAGKVRLPDAIHKVEIAKDVSFDLLTRGVQPVVAPDFFANKQTQAVIQRLESAYDLILIDGPPLMQVAYAGNLARIAGSTVAVISHGSSVKAAEELKGRLAFIESSVLGYVYNRAPFRVEMFETGGSMKDILGDSGFVESVTPRQR
jgi:Mrp family chromosome partitioning ATPase